MCGSEQLLGISHPRRPLRSSGPAHGQRRRRCGRVQFRGARAALQVAVPEGRCFTGHRHATSLRAGVGLQSDHSGSLTRSRPLPVRRGITRGRSCRRMSCSRMSCSRMSCRRMSCRTVESQKRCPARTFTFIRSKSCRTRPNLRLIGRIDSRIFAFANSGDFLCPRHREVSGFPVPAADFRSAGHRPDDRESPGTHVPANSMCRPTVEAAGERARCPVSPSQPAPRRSRAQKGAAERRARPDSRGLSGEHCGTTNQRAGRHRHHRRTHRARLLPTAPARSCGVRAHRADSQGVVRQHRRRRGGDSSPARRRGSCLHERPCASRLVRTRAERAPRSRPALGLTAEISAGPPHSRRQCGIEASGSSPEPICTDR